MSAHAELRKMIAEAEGKRRNGPASDGRGWFRTAADDVDCYAVADAVLDLFPDVVTEYVRLRPGWVLPAGDLDGDHVRYVLRTAPEPVEGDQCPRC